MNISEIQDLIKLVSRSGVTEVAIEQKEMKITIKSDNEGRKKKQKGQTDDQPGMPQQMPVMPMPAMQPMQQQAPPAQPQPQPAPQQESGKPAPNKDDGKQQSQTDEANYETVKSPMIGTFYRASGPDKDPFVKVGDEIKTGQVICVIEAMKLFNEIEAETSGRIVKVLVDDASPVEYDQPLFLVDPAK